VTCYLPIALPDNFAALRIYAPQIPDILKEACPY